MTNDVAPFSKGLSHDPSSEAVKKLLNGWIRSERAFRGREVWKAHSAPDGSVIDRGRYLLLRELVHGGPRRLMDLADALTLTRSHASRIVDSLVRNGLVARDVPDDDRRVTMISITERGQDLTRALDARSRSLIAERLSCFTSEEATLFGDLFVRFAAEVERWSDIESARGRNGHRDPR